MSKQLLPLHEAVKQSFENPARDFAAFNTALSKFKLAAATLPAPADEADRRYVHDLSRDVLEMAAVAAAHVRDMDALGRHIAQLKDYYAASSLALARSERESLISGLELLRLLALNKLGDFHAELERIPFQKHLTDPFIAYPIQLEQCLMEGSNRKLCSLLSNQNGLPSPIYAAFNELLLSSTRNEAALSIEAAYDTLSVNYAAELLMLGNVQEAIKFGASRGWTLLQPQGNAFVFCNGSAAQTRGGRSSAQQHQAPSGAQPALNAQTVILDTLHYAREMERIV